MTFGRLFSRMAATCMITGVAAACRFPESPSHNHLQPTGIMAESSDKIIVYQMMPRLFGNTSTTNRKYGTPEENGVGKLADITPLALQEIKKLGATHVWFTGVIEHATMTDYSAYGIAPDDVDVVKGRAGSPYAIKDYYDIDPDLATSVPNRKQEFAQLLERTHIAGLKAIIDFVPNHVARSYTSDAAPGGIEPFGASDNATESFLPSNNFYYIPGQAFQVPAGYDPLPGESHPAKDGLFAEHPAKATGNDVFSAAPSIHDWFETVKLNYGVDYLNGRSGHFDPIPDTWLKMRQILSYWAGLGVNGFRCDMAEMVPVEFWEWVIPKIKEEHPGILFIAEIYKPEEYRNYISRGHFDYLYDKVELYDVLRHIIQGHATTDDLTQVWQKQEGIQQHMLRFLENHDEQRIASPYFAGQAEYAIPAMVLSATMHTGPVMVYFGQEVGEPAAGNEGFQGEDGRTTIFDYWGVPRHQAWMNNGKFDGGQLTPVEKKLRETYRFILNFSKDEELIRLGSFYDLHYYNRTHESEGYSNRVFAFVRHSRKEGLLIASSFNKYKKEKVKVTIPTDALKKFGMGSHSGVAYKEVVAAGKKSGGLGGFAYVQDNGEILMEFEIEPNGFRIFRLTP